MARGNIITSYMDKNHRVIRKIRSVHPNPSIERAMGYLANQHFVDRNNRRVYAVYAEVYEEDTTLQHGSLKFKPGSGEVRTLYKKNPRDYENRYAITPSLEQDIE